MVNLKEKLQKNELTVGSWLSLAHPAIAEMMAKIGFDWLTVDMEHSAITLPQAQSLVQVIGLSGCVPLVRVGENNSGLIKRVMDAGAHGVIVPMVNSRDDAEKAVSAVRYPPLGTRGVGLARAQGYGLSFEEYKTWLEKESLVIVQIEHIKAIENLEEILDVPGIDASIIGPYDLSGSLGFPGEFEREEVQRVLERYEAVCCRKSKPMGLHVVEPEPGKALSYIDKGYTFLAVGLDTLYLGRKCQDVLGKIRR